MAPRLATTAANARHGTELQIHEWSVAGPDTHPELIDLSFSGDPGVVALVKTLSQQGVVDVTELRGGLRVETASYVGRIAVGPLNISILPKLAWQRWIGVFGFAMRLRGLLRTEELAVRTSPTSLHDLVILELLAEARDLVGRGLHREYVRHREQLATPRGRIDFNRIALAGGIREAAIPCRFTRRSDDFHLNRVLLAGLRAASTLATDVRLRTDVRRLAHQLGDSVSGIALTADAVATAFGGLDRRTARYAPTLELIDLLRRGMLFSIEQPDSATPAVVRGFALDMNALWQRLLARVLREWLPNVEVREEHSLRHLIRPDPDYSPRRRGGHVPRPDFAVFSNGRLVTYLDAKYRDIWEKGVPRDMLYQLALYAAAHEGGTSAILYPTEHLEAAEERVRIHDQVDESIRATVAMRPIVVADLERLFAAPLTRDVVRQRSLLANHLLHGADA